MFYPVCTIIGRTAWGQILVLVLCIGHLTFNIMPFTYPPLWRWNDQCHCYQLPIVSSVIKCHQVSSSIIKHRQVSSSVIKWSAIKHHQVSSSIIYCFVAILHEAFCLQPPPQASSSVLNIKDIRIKFIITMLIMKILIDMIHDLLFKEKLQLCSWS